MRDMTRAQVVEVIRRGVRDAGSYRAYGARVGLEASWLSQLVNGRGSCGPHTLRQLGLAAVIVESPVAEEASAPIRPARPYRRMWELGDWPRGMIG